MGFDICLGPSTVMPTRHYSKQPPPPPPQAELVVPTSHQDVRYSGCPCIADGTVLKGASSSETMAIRQPARTEPTYTVRGQQLKSVFQLLGRKHVS